MTNAAVKAIKVSETSACTRWEIQWPSCAGKQGKVYRATTYPGSQLIFIETFVKRRAIGGTTKTALEPIIRQAIERATA